MFHDVPINPLTCPMPETRLNRERSPLLGAWHRNFRLCFAKSWQKAVILMEHVCDALGCPGLHAPEITQNAVDLQPPGSLAKFCQRPTSIHKYFMHNVFHTQLSCVTIWRWVPNPSPRGDLRFVHLDVAKSCAAGGSWTSWCCMRCFNVFNVYLTIKYRDSTGSIMMYNKDTVGI